MSDTFTLRQIAGLDRRISQTEVRETPPFGVGARVYNSANLSINNLTMTALTFNSERYDPLGMHSTSVNTSRLTIPYAGIYLLTFTGNFAANANGFRQFLFRLNGTATVFGEHVVTLNSPANATSITMSTLYRLSAGDYVEMNVQQNSGGALNILALPDYSPEFAIHRVA